MWHMMTGVLDKKEVKLSNKDAEKKNIILRRNRDSKWADSVCEFGRELDSQPGYK